MVYPKNQKFKSTLFNLGKQTNNRIGELKTKMKFKNKFKQAKQIATGISDVHKCPYCHALMAEIKYHARNGHKPNEETTVEKQK